MSKSVSASTNLSFAIFLVTPKEFLVLRYVLKDAFVFAVFLSPWLDRVQSCLLAQSSIQAPHIILYRYNLNLFTCYQEQFEPVPVMMLLGTGISDVNYTSWCHCTLQNEFYRLPKTQIHRTLLVSSSFFRREFLWPLHSDHCHSKTYQGYEVHELSYVYLTM